MDQDLEKEEQWRSFGSGSAAGPPRLAEPPLLDLLACQATAPHDLLLAETR